MGEKDTTDRAIAETNPQLQYAPPAEIDRVRAAATDPFSECALVADLCRLNTLYMIMRAGSGHIGSSFSAMDIVTWLWLRHMRSPNDPRAAISDVYFSSKGHDAPGLYSLLIALGKLPMENLHQLRRLGGLPGHPDVRTPFIATNTGSLGMGISKAFGMARAARLRGADGRFYVMTGDGELQEGQIWESLQPAANDQLREITVIVDHNKMQSDSAVNAVSDLGRLEGKWESFGWDVHRCDGHDFAALERALANASERPRVIIADTIKGKGVSFMEGIACGDETYKFHAGAPSIDDYRAAVVELVGRIDDRLGALGVAPLELESVELPPRQVPRAPERLVEAYGQELLAIAHERQDVVVLDADLISDCGIVAFKRRFPDRFIECGIAEQHMVSAAGGLALKGLLPIAHSFACFLSTRANEQIYNNATEGRRIIYTATLAGMLPGGPGHSHQSVRDISAIGAVPGLVAMQPCNERESRLAIRWAVERNHESTYLRFVNVPLDLPYTLPVDYELEMGRGVFLSAGDDAAIVAYGPVLLKSASAAAEALRAGGFSVAVVNCPWLNRIDAEWFVRSLGRYPLVVTLDDHYSLLGQGSLIAATFGRAQTARPELMTLGLDEVPACGTNAEVLAYHRLDAESVAGVVRERLTALNDARRSVVSV
jgi:transketolase